MAALIGLAGGTVRAEDFTIRAASAHLAGEVYLVNASIDYRFSPRALEALKSGVPLTIRIDLVIEQSRDYWTDLTVAELEQRYQIQYHALSGLYVLRNLNSGASELFSSLDLALISLGVVNDLPLIDENLMEAEARYEIAMRAELEIDSLPAPLRPFAYVTPSWWMESDWYRWSLTR